MLTNGTQSEPAGLIGVSRAVRDINEDIDLAARSDAKVLITGETGVGKEVIAGMIHRRSARGAARLITINCAGVPDSLLESELFGHARGSFTGAYRDKAGILESADRGTVLLDEVGEMSLRMQAALLRFLETGELQRVGADRAHGRVNVRILAATNRDFAGHIASGGFRQDLYYRLNVIHLHMSPLRERREDIPVLLEHFIERCCREYRLPQPKLSPEALDVLTAADWPGNVRQLKNVVERMVLKQSGPIMRPANIPPDVPRQAFVERPEPDRAEFPSAPSLVAEMVEKGQSFWTVVYPRFMDRDLCRSTLRKVVAIGLEQTVGSYKSMVPLFNMPPSDYKRFLAFLRKHGCLLRFHEFRVHPMRRLPTASRMPASMPGPTQRPRIGPPPSSLLRN
jgi:transcriptional regulator with GAF, ATPase, and Fis domain